MLHPILFAMGIGRIVLGLAPFVAAGPSARLLGFPAHHDNATARLMGRLFGVRDVGLGVLVFYGLKHPEVLGFLVLFNALTDFGDVVAVGVALAGREGIDRGALASGAMALPAGLAWLGVLALLG